MHTISQEAYRFLVDSYEKSVEIFFDDPTEYADGDSLKQVFEELKKLGDELEIDILSLAVDNDLDRLEQYMKQEEEGDFWSEGFQSYDSRWTPHPASSEGSHMEMGKSGYPLRPSLGTSRPYVPAALFEDNEKENRSVEEKLKKLSQDRHPDEMIGEWTTYEMEED